MDFLVVFFVIGNVAIVCYWLIEVGLFDINFN